MASDRIREGGFFSGHHRDREQRQRREPEVVSTYCASKMMIRVVRDEADCIDVRVEASRRALRGDWESAIKTLASKLYLAEQKSNLEPLVRELVAALKSAEWVDDSTWGELCPYCSMQEKCGHRPDCELSIALDHAKERGFE